MKLLKFLCSIIAIVIIFSSCSDNVSPIVSCKVPISGYGDIIMPEVNLRHYYAKDSIVYKYKQFSDGYYYQNLKNGEEGKLFDFKEIVSLIQLNPNKQNRNIFSVYLDKQINEDLFLLIYQFNLFNNDTINLNATRFDLCVFDKNKNQVYDINFIPYYNNIGFQFYIHTAIEEISKLKYKLHIVTQDEKEYDKPNYYGVISFSSILFDIDVFSDTNCYLYKSKNNNVEIKALKPYFFNFFVYNSINSYNFVSQTYKLSSNFTVSPNDSLISSVSESLKRIFISNFYTKEEYFINLLADYCVYIYEEPMLTFWNNEELIFKGADVNERIEHVYKLNIRTKKIEILPLN